MFAASTDIVLGQSVSVFDTVYVPAGYTDGPGTATMFVPSIRNGIGVILVHGATGSRQNTRPWCDTLAAYGYVAMSIEYPDPDVTSSAVYPKGARAVKLAVEFLRRNASRFGISTGKIVGWGMSLGAMMWSETMIWDNEDAYFQTDSSVDDHLDAAILLYGYYYAQYGTSQDSLWSNNYFSNDPAKFAMGVPMGNVGNITTPVLFLHGTADGLCIYHESVQFHDSLLAHGTESQLLLFPGQPHVFDLNGYSQFTPSGLIAKDTALAFLKRILRPALKVHLSSASIDFGSNVIGEGDSITASISNIGVEPLNVNSIGNGSPAFELLNLPALPFAVSPGSSLDFAVAFRPDASGFMVDTIHIQSDDPVYPSANITLRGKGIAEITPASPGVLYATSAGVTQGNLYSINTTTGTVDEIGALGTSEIHGLAIRHADNVMFGSSTNVSSTRMFRVSSLGDAVRSWELPVGNMRAIAFSPGDTLFGATTTGTLYRIDLSDGHVDSLGATPGLKYYGLSFSPISHQLWASVRLPIDSIFVVNTSTGAATLVGTTGFGALTFSIAFDQVGNLFGLIDNGSGEDYLASIDTNNGSGVILAGPLSIPFLQAIAIRSDQGTTSVSQVDKDKPPQSYELNQNYPNPFNPLTTIRYALSSSGHVQLSVYNMLGQVVATLVDEVQEPGYRSIVFDASHLPSGVYISKLSVGTFTDERKLLLVR